MLWVMVMVLARVKMRDLDGLCQTTGRRVNLRITRASSCCSTQLLLHAAARTRSC